MVADVGAVCHGSDEDIVLIDRCSPRFVELAGIDPLISKFVADNCRLEEKDAYLDAL